MHVIFICVEAVLLGASYVFPSLPPLLGHIMFWGGIAGLILYPLWLNREWIFKRVDPSSIIVGCLVGAAGLLVIAAIIFVSNPLARTITTVPPPAVARPQIEFVRGINIAINKSGDTPLFIEILGTATATVDRLRIAIDYSKFFIPGWSGKQRILIDELRDVVRGQDFRVQFASQGTPESVYRTFFWGKPDRERREPIAFGPNRVRIAFIGPSGEEQYYYCLLIRTYSREEHNEFLILKEDALNFPEEWKAER